MSSSATSVPELLIAPLDQRWDLVKRDPLHTLHFRRFGRLTDALSAATKEDMMRTYGLPEASQLMEKSS